MDFARTHRTAGKPLQAWRKVIESGTFANFAQLKAIMNATDRVGDFYVFDIGGRGGPTRLNSFPRFVRWNFCSGLRSHG